MISNVCCRYHLPGLFEFADFYEKFLPLYKEHSEWFYEWCEIGSIYGAPEGCIWGGGRTGSGECNRVDLLKLLKKCGIEARLTFSNSLLTENHLTDKKCNKLCEIFQKEATGAAQNGVIVHSDLLTEYLKATFPELYLVSSTTKVLTDFEDFLKELDREDFRYVVPDFRLNKQFEKLHSLNESHKKKVEFLCNECCWIGCRDRKACYENVSKKNLGLECEDFKCRAPDGNGGYIFSKAMENPAFIGIQDIQEKYIPMGFSNFKIEGRGLGSAILLEFILYYLTKPQYQLKVRENLYLDSMLDLF